MTAGAIPGLLLPSIASYLLIRRVWYPLKAGPGLHLAAAIAPGLGVGFASCLYFALLHLRLGRGAVVRLDAALWLTAIIALLIDARRPRTSVAAHGDRERGVSSLWTAESAITVLGLSVLSAVALYAFWLRWSIRPEGEWDAFAIWNLRARALARGAPDWGAIFSPALEWSSPHYPLLMPLTVARLWAYTNGESTAVPATVALLFFLSSLAFVVVAVGRLRGWPAGCLSGMALLVARTYVYQGACQCGDVPVGFYMLVAIACVAMSLYTGESGPLLVTAGAAAGLAAWTKDEGLPLLVFVALTAAIRRPRLRSMLSIAAGAAVPVGTLVLFKLHVATSSYLFGQQAGGILQKLTDSSRWARVGQGLLTFGTRWGEVPGGAIVFLAIAVALTVYPSRRSAVRASSGVLLVMAMMCAYSLVYVVTPLPLEWQMAVSFDRLFVQLWPALVWAAFQFSGFPSAAGAAGTSR